VFEEICDHPREFAATVNAFLTEIRRPLPKLSSKLTATSDEGFFRGRPSLSAIFSQLSRYRDLADGRRWRQWLA
jgi:hypothetical protein